MIAIITVIIAIATIFLPLATVAGYLSLDQEPKRHDLIGKAVPILFMILAASDALSDKAYIQAGAAAFVALSMFIFRNHFDQAARLKGRYVQMFMFFAAIYFVSGLTVSSFGAAALFVAGAFGIPFFFALIAPVGGLDLGDEEAEKIETEFELSPVDETKTAAKQYTEPPKPQPASPTAQQKVYMPVDIIVSATRNATEEEAKTMNKLPSSSMPNELKSSPAPVEQIKETPSETAPTHENEAAEEPSRTVEVEPSTLEEDDERVGEFQAAKARRKDSGEKLPTKPDDTKLELPELPPRPKAAEPFKSQGEEKELKTEQPKQKTSGVKFDLNAERGDDKNVD